MKTTNQDEIPKSVIKGSGFISADLGSLKGKGKILFLNPSCIIIGLDDSPYALFLSAKFNQMDIPASLRQNIIQVKKLIIDANFSSEISSKINYYEIDDWLHKFQNLESLNIKNAYLDKLDIFKNAPIKFLELRSIKCLDTKKVSLSISSLKKLKQISFDDSVPQDVIKSIQKLNIKLLKLDKDDF